MAFASSSNPDASNSDQDAQISHSKVLLSPTQESSACDSSFQQSENLQRGNLSSSPIQGVRTPGADDLSYRLARLDFMAQSSTRSEQSTDTRGYGSLPQNQPSRKARHVLQKQASSGNAAYGNEFNVHPSSRDRIHHPESFPEGTVFTGQSVEAQLRARRRPYRHLGQPSPSHQGAPPRHSASPEQPSMVELSEQNWGFMRELIRTKQIYSGQHPSQDYPGSQPRHSTQPLSYQGQPIQASGPGNLELDPFGINVQLNPPKPYVPDDLRPEDSSSNAAAAAAVNSSLDAGQVSGTIESSSTSTTMSTSEPEPEPHHTPASSNNTPNDWSPLDDGIEVLLPGSDKAPSREEVDAYTSSLSRGRTRTKRRLPVFEQICKGNE